MKRLRSTRRCRLSPDRRSAKASKLQTVPGPELIAQQVVDLRRGLELWISRYASKELLCKAMTPRLTLTRVERRPSCAHRQQVAPCARWHQ